MQNAVILINTDKGQVKAVAERLADVEGISEVYSTCGRYDLVAIARTRDFESLAELVTERLNAVEGISDTETLNAMQVHSRHDLETMFSLVGSPLLFGYTQSVHERSENEKALM